MLHFSISSDPYYGSCRRKTPMENSRKELVVQQREQNSTHRTLLIPFVSEIDSLQRFAKSEDCPLLEWGSSSEPKGNLELMATVMRRQSPRERFKTNLNGYSPNRLRNCPNGTEAHHNSSITPPLFVPELYLSVALPCKGHSRAFDLWRFLTTVSRCDGQRPVSEQKGHA